MGGEETPRDRLDRGETLTSETSCEWEIGEDPSVVGVVIMRFLFIHSLEVDGADRRGRIDSSSECRAREVRHCPLTDPGVVDMESRLECCVTVTGKEVSA